MKSIIKSFVGTALIAGTILFVSADDAQAQMIKRKVKPIPQDCKEDIRDRREDRRDRAEDRRDRKEDIHDRREDIRDRKEDRRDRRTGPCKG